MAELGANARFWIAAEDGERAFGPGPAELLVHIQELGSIRQAACAMQMSYTKALRILEGSETALGVSLVTRNAGGADGGGAKLTPQGADLALRYKAWEEASKKAAEEAYQAAFAGLLAPRLGCCILASGRGVRVGGQKLLAPLGDGTVLHGAGGLEGLLHRIGDLGDVEFGGAAVALDDLGDHVLVLLFRLFYDVFHNLSAGFSTRCCGSSVFWVPHMVAVPPALCKGVFHGFSCIR